jgi:hypothetical protein
MNASGGVVECDLHTMNTLRRHSHLPPPSDPIGHSLLDCDRHQAEQTTDAVRPDSDRVWWSCVVIPAAPALRWSLWRVRAGAGGLSWTAQLQRLAAGPTGTGHCESHRKQHISIAHTVGRTRDGSPRSTAGVWPASSKSMDRPCRASRAAVAVTSWTNVQLAFSWMETNSKCNSRS